MKKLNDLKYSMQILFILLYIIYEIYYPLCSFTVN